MGPASPSWFVSRTYFRASAGHLFRHGSSGGTGGREALLRAVHLAGRGYIPRGRSPASRRARRRCRGCRASRRTPAGSRPRALSSRASPSTKRSPRRRGRPGRTGACNEGDPPPSEQNSGGISLSVGHPATLALDRRRSDYRRALTMPLRRHKSSLRGRRRSSCTRCTDRSGSRGRIEKPAVQGAVSPPAAFMCYWRLRCAEERSTFMSEPEQGVRRGGARSKKFTRTSPST